MLGRNIGVLLQFVHHLAIESNTSLNNGCDKFGPEPIGFPVFRSPWTNGPVQNQPLWTYGPQKFAPLNKWSPINLVPIFLDPHSLSP